MEMVFDAALGTQLNSGEDFRVSLFVLEEPGYNEIGRKANQSFRSVHDLI